MDCLSALCDFQILTPSRGELQLFYAAVKQQRNQAKQICVDTREMGVGFVECQHEPHAVGAREICNEEILCIAYCFWEPVK